MKFFLLALVILFSPSCSDQKRTENSQQVLHDSSAKLHDHNQEVWTCPMHPQIVKSTPGKCPICHMDLVKVNKEDTDLEEGDSLPQGHAPVTLNEARQQLIGVQTGEVKEKELFKTIEASGRVAFDPDLYTAQTEFIEAIRQRERVKNSSVAEVKHSAARMVESAKLRLKVLGLSDEYINKLARGGESGSSLLIPKAGESLWVYGEIFEMDLPFIHPGLTTKISGNALGRKELIGKVVSVDRVINPNTRTAKVRIIVPDVKLNLRPESYLEISILSPLGKQVTVPFSAVLDTGKEAWVFVVEDTKFRPQLITIIERAGDEVAVSSGVKPGDKIVTSANFLIDSESRLKGVMLDQRESGKKEPDCPPGQSWHEQMNHCMDRP